MTLLGFDVVVRLCWTVIWDVFVLALVVGRIRVIVDIARLAVILVVLATRGDGVGLARVGAGFVAGRRDVVVEGAGQYGRPPVMYAAGATKVIGGGYGTQTRSVIEYDTSLA